MLRIGVVAQVSFAGSTVYIHHRSVTNRSNILSILANTVSPLFKTKILLEAVKKVLITSSNAIIINSVLTRECDAFSNVPVFGVHTENGSFSDLCIFISDFEKLRFHSGAM